jgi:hypothetical protein
MSIWRAFWRVVWALIPAITFWEAIQPIPARADTAAALTAIADTADRICGIVSTQGEAGSNKVQGDIHAELNGLARRLATLGGSGSVDISSSKYQGLLQQDLPTALKDLRECKLKVFQQLQGVILPGTVQQSGVGAPTPELLQAPANAPIVDTARTGDQRAEIGLYSCSNETASISCYVVLSRIAVGQQEYSISSLRTDQFKLVDNFHIEHRLRRAYFIDGLGSHEQTTNLSTGESVWLALEFDPVARPISSARIIFSSLWERPNFVVG